MLITNACDLDKKSVSWYKCKLFCFSQYQQFSVLLSQICEKNNLLPDHITLMFKEQVVSVDKTPKSIGYIQGLVLRMYL